MGRGIQAVDEPGPGSDGCGDAEGEILGEFEGLEVIEDERLVGGVGDAVEGPLDEQHAVASDAGGLAGYGGGSAVEVARELAMGRAGLEPFGDGDQQLGPFAEVGRREGSLTEAPPAGRAAVALDLVSVVETMEAVLAVAEAWGGAEVLGAVRSGTEWGLEFLQSLNRCREPIHTAMGNKLRAVLAAT